MTAWEVSNYEPYKSVAIMQDGQVIADLNDVAGGYEERLGRASRICDAVNAYEPGDDSPFSEEAVKHRTYFLAGYEAGRSGKAPATQGQLAKLGALEDDQHSYAFGFTEGARRLVRKAA